jgi:uncharacterized protein (DUF885 family)
MFSTPVLDRTIFNIALKTPFAYYLGWSRAKAIAYMREHSMDSDSYINSETLSEGADLPAAALAYKIGSREFIELRDKAKRELGSRFDIHQFHKCVLENGSMPLAVLAKHCGLVH